MSRPHGDSQGYYRALRLMPGATEEQIQLAYEAVCELPAGDRGATPGQIDRAYQVLKDPASRRAYDRMETSPVPAPPRRRLRLDDMRLLAACLLMLGAILVFVWLPLYGSRFRNFANGDRLLDLQGAPFGVVIQTAELHDFGSGATAPGYLVELAATKELRWFPEADIQATCRRAK